MADPIEELIQEITRKHNLALSRDDPLLVLQTINTRLLHDSAKAQQEQLARYKEELEALSQRWGQDAKNKAERILNASLSASKEEMHTLLHTYAQTLASAVRTEMQTLLAQGSTTLLQNTQRTATLNVLSSCLTLVAACASLFWKMR